MAGTLTISTLSDGTNSTSSTNPIRGSALAWVNFNGNSGSVGIYKSYNVSSVTYISAGRYTLTFTNSLPNTYYIVLGETTPDTNNGNNGIAIAGLCATSTVPVSKTTAQVTVMCETYNTTQHDTSEAGFVCIGSA